MKFLEQLIKKPDIFQRTVGLSSSSRKVQGKLMLKHSEFCTENPQLNRCNN